MKSENDKMKNIISKLSIVMGIFIILFATTQSVSASTSESAPINTQIWNIQDINTINVNYPSDKIILLTSPTNEIILKEYSNKNNPLFYANTEQFRNILNINAGKRPWFFYTFYIEIYIPTNYLGDINIMTSSGDIYAEPKSNLTLNNVEFNSKSGKISTSNVLASNINLYSKSGKITANKIQSTLDCETTSGTIQIINSSIKGNVSSVSGKIDFNSNNISGNINTYSKSGRIIAALSENNQCIFSAKTNSGTIKNNFGMPLEFEIDKKYLTGSIGPHPTNSIIIETKSGTIEVNKAN